MSETESMQFEGTLTDVSGNTKPLLAIWFGNVQKIPHEGAFFNTRLAYLPDHMQPHYKNQLGNKFRVTCAVAKKPSGTSVSTVITIEPVIVMSREPV